MLLTAVVKVGEGQYTTQLRVEEIADAVPRLLESDGFREFAELEVPAWRGSPFSRDEVFLVMPMDCLVNAWLAQGGRNGEYFSVVLVRTEEGHD
jgi:hypothetical protein